MDANGMLFGAQRHPHYVPHDYPRFINHADPNANVNRMAPDEVNGICQNAFARAQNPESGMPVGNIAPTNSTTPPSAYPLPTPWNNFNQNVGRTDADGLFHPEIYNVPRMDNRFPDWRNICTFTTSMVNEAVQQQGTSLYAWYVNFCRPSTSNADAQPANKPNRKRKQNLKGSPNQVPDNVQKNSPAQAHPQQLMFNDRSVTPGKGMPNVTRSQPVQASSSSHINPHTSTVTPVTAGVPLLPVPTGMTANSVNVSAAADLVMVPEENDLEINGEGPLRRMEKMTQDSIFEPLNKQPRAANVDNIQPSKRDEDRNAKLAKMKTLEEQILNSKQREIDRVMHETQGFTGVPNMMQPFSHAQFAPPAQHLHMQAQSQQMFQACRPNFVQPGPPNQMMQPVVPNQMMHPAVSNQMMQPVVSNQMMQPAVSNQMMQAVSSNHMMQPASSHMQPVSSNQMMQPLGAVSGPNMVQATMPMSQPLRPSVNGPPYNSPYPHEAFYGGQFPVNNAYPPHHEHPQEVNQMMQNGYPGVFHPNGPHVVHPRGFHHPQDIRPMYPPRLPAQMDMWNNHLPQPINNIEARVPNQKIQYHSAVP